MDWILAIALALCLHCARDGIGLAAFPGPGLRAVYCCALLLAGGVLGGVAERLSLADASALAADPLAWASAIAVHVALWILFEAGRQSDRFRPVARWLLVIPPPLLLYAVGAAIWHGLRWVNLPGPMAGSCFMAVYGAAALALASAACRRASGGPRPAVALEFLAISNASGLLLALLPYRSRGGRTLPWDVDWGQTLSVLGIVASIIGASFLWARLRSSY